MLLDTNIAYFVSYTNILSYLIIQYFTQP